MFFAMVLGVLPVAAACTIIPDNHYMNSGVRDGWVAYADKHMTWNYGICYGYYPRDSLTWDTNGEVFDLLYTNYNFNGGSISTDGDTYSLLYLDERSVVKGRNNQFFVELYATNSGTSYVIDEFQWNAYDPYWDMDRWYIQELDRHLFTVI